MPKKTTDQCDIQPKPLTFDIPQNFKLRKQFTILILNSDLQISEVETPFSWVDVISNY